MFTGKDKSIGSNIVGGALIAGGSTYALNSHLKSKEFELLGNSIYTSALSQTYLSTPIIHLCGSLQNKIDDSHLNTNFTVVLDSWKESVIYLYNKQREQLVERLKKFNVSEAKNIQTLLKDPNSIQEVGEFVAFMKIIGLANHKIFDLLNTLFKEILPKHFDNSEAIMALEVSKKQQHKAKLISASIIAIGIIIALFIAPNVSRKKTENALGIVSWIFDICGILVGVWLSQKAKTKEMKDFETIYNQAIDNINSIAISRDDFNFNLIES